MPALRHTILSAVHLFLQKEGTILFARRYNTGYEDGKFSVVAGHLDGGETVKQAMIREAREEAGITIKPEDLTVVGVMHRLSEDERIDWFLHTTRWEGEVANLEPYKCDLLQWFPIENPPSNVIPYVRRALNNFRQNIWFDSFGFPDG
ncbi:MAG: NUDIX domain-containing protein [Anaerolineales bacterium]|nr:NUDIX domain-containing protein [Anaerolineales bacterium]